MLRATLLVLLSAFVLVGFTAWTTWRIQVRLDDPPDSRMELSGAVRMEPTTPDYSTSWKYEPAAGGVATHTVATKCGEFDPDETRDECRARHRAEVAWWQDPDGGGYVPLPD